MGYTINVDGSAVTLAGSHASNNTLVTTGSSSSALVQITQSGAGGDIAGTGATWSISKAGAIDCVSVTADSVVAGDGSSTGVVASSGNYDLKLQTGNSTTGNITITDGAAGAITLDCNGAGAVVVPGNAGGTVFDITAGDATMQDGSLTITDADNASTLVVTNNTASTGTVILVTADAIANGKGMQIDCDGGVGAAGAYFDAYNGSASVFTVGEAGAVTIAGSAAGTDALTLTVGDILLNDSDQNIIESEDGTTTTLLIDNKAGVIASDNAVLKLDAGGAIASGGNIFRVEATGTPASGAVYVELDFAGFTDTNENVGVLIDAGGKKVQALSIDADPAAGDVVYVHSDAAIAADKALLNLNSAGAVKSGGNVLRVDLAASTPASGAVYCEFDFAGFTDTNENVGVLIDAGGKKVQALSIDADPAAGDVVLVHSDAAIASDKALLRLDSAGAVKSGGNVLRVDLSNSTPASGAVYVEFDFAGFTDTNENVGLLIDAGGKKVQALSIDADPAAGDVAYFHTDAAIADNKAVLSLHSAGAMVAGSSILRLAQAGTPAGATSYTFEIDNTGSTTTNNAVCMRVDNHTSTGAVFQATSAGAAAPLLDLYSTNTGATGVVIKTTHTSTSSAAANDVVLSLQAWGLDDGDASEEYGRIEVVATGVGAGAETSALKFYVTVNGTSEVAATFKTDTILAGTGSAAATVTSNGSQDLTVSTNETAANEPKIVLTDGATGNITLTAGGTSGEIDFASPIVTTSEEDLDNADPTATKTVSILKTGGARARTLGDHTVEGFIKIITMDTDGGDYTLTITTGHTVSQIVFDAVGESAILMWIDGAWAVLGSYGCTIT